MVRHPVIAAAVLLPLWATAIIGRDVVKRREHIQSSGYCQTYAFNHYFSSSGEQTPSSSYCHAAIVLGATDSPGFLRQQKEALIFSKPQTQVSPSYSSHTARKQQTTTLPRLWKYEKRKATGIPTADARLVL
jgi:hypothetical protein